MGKTQNVGGKNMKLNNKASAETVWNLAHQINGFDKFVSELKSRGLLEQERKYILLQCDICNCKMMPGGTSLRLCRTCHDELIEKKDHLAEAEELRYKMNSEINHANSPLYYNLNRLCDLYGKAIKQAKEKNNV